MNLELARKVADAVLYEGYMLYPYRPSALKNRQRWGVGILYPPAYGEVVSGTERARMHTECLVNGTSNTAVRVQVRFLHFLSRQVGQRVGGRFEPVTCLIIDGKSIESWDEAAERRVEFEWRLGKHQKIFEFSFPGSVFTESLLDGGGKEVGRVTRVHLEVRGTVSIAARPLPDAVWKLTIEVTNASSLAEDPSDRKAALMRSLISAHTFLTVNEGEFISLLDPPESRQKDARECANVGNFPVLLGNPGEHDVLLCSPILLYDYPQVAPESVGDFYDATEIDEMLTLRVATLTDSEKEHMRNADDRVRALLERTDQTLRQQLTRNHGTFRGPSTGR